MNPGALELSLLCAGVLGLLLGFLLGFCAGRVS